MLHHRRSFLQLAVSREALAFLRPTPGGWMAARRRHSLVAVGYRRCQRSTRRLVRRGGMIVVRNWRVFTDRDISARRLSRWPLISGRSSCFVRIALWRVGVLSAVWSGRVPRLSGMNIRNRRVLHDRPAAAPRPADELRLSPACNARGVGLICGCGITCARAICCGLTRTMLRITGCALRNASAETAVVATV